MITATPTQFELHNEADLLAKIEMLDAHASNIEIKTVVSPGTWPELSAAIAGALAQMHPPAPGGQT